MSSHPDAELFPEATGLAKKTVDKHQDKQRLVLYAGWFCPFVQRIWAMLEEKKIPYQYVEVNPYKKEASFLNLNPRGLVPTLQYDDGSGPKPLYESTIMGEFLEEAYPDHGMKLLPSDPYQRAVSRIWTDFVTTRIIPSFHRLLQFEPGQTDRSLDDVRAELINHLKSFTEAMDKDGPYFFGMEPGLIDFAVAPWVLRFWAIDRFKEGGVGIPTDGDVWARWRKWRSAIESRDSIKETTSDAEHYLPIYQRYADNKAQSELAKAIRSGRGVP